MGTSDIVKLQCQRSVPCYVRVRCENGAVLPKGDGILVHHLDLLSVAGLDGMHHAMMGRAVVTMHGRDLAPGHPEMDGAIYYRSRPTWGSPDTHASSAAASSSSSSSSASASASSASSASSSSGSGGGAGGAGRWNRLSTKRAYSSAVICGSAKAPGLAWPELCGRVQGLLLEIANPRGNSSFLTAFRQFVVSRTPEKELPAVWRPLSFSVSASFASDGGGGGGGGGRGGRGGSGGSSGSGGKSGGVSQFQMEGGAGGDEGKDGGAPPPPGPPVGDGPFNEYLASKIVRNSIEAARIAAFIHRLRLFVDKLPPGVASWDLSTTAAAAASVPSSPSSSSSSTSLTPSDAATMALPNAGSLRLVILSKFSFLEAAHECLLTTCRGDECRLTALTRQMQSHGFRRAYVITYTIWYSRRDGLGRTRYAYYIDQGERT